MYLQHFGFREYPFSLTPDTSFFYGYASHQEALNVLLVALRSGEGFIKVTGEVGLGKTLLCRKLLDSLGDGFVTAFLPNPHLSPGSMRLALAEELGVGVSNRATQEDMLRAISRRLLQLAGAGTQVVVCLDEVQAMPNYTLEAVRLLTNLETEKFKLLQVVMFGQPELDARLKGIHLRQLQQRITFSYRLVPLDKQAVAEYVRHRLRVAGYHGAPLFTERALAAVYRGSGGIPRLVNILCHKALLAAFGPGEDYITLRHVRRAVADTEGARRLTPRFLHPLIYAAVIGAVGLVAGMMYWLETWR